MITFNNFQRGESFPFVDITLPIRSLVYLDGNKINSNIWHTKAFAGEILYHNIPIFACSKSFMEKVCCEIKINEMFEPRLTLIENLRIYAQICSAELILNAPITFFQIPQSLLNKKVSEIQEEVVNVAECGLLFYFRHKICTILNVTEKLSQNENVKHLIKTRVENGHDMIIYTGKNFDIENTLSIKI